MGYVIEKEIDFNGRIVIPVDIRKALNITAYDILAIKVEDNKIIIERTTKSKDKNTPNERKVNRHNPFTCIYFYK